MTDVDRNDAGPMPADVPDLDARADQTPEPDPIIPPPPSPPTPDPEPTEPEPQPSPMASPARPAMATA